MASAPDSIQTVTPTRTEFKILAITTYSVVLAIHVMAAIAAFGFFFAYPLVLTAVRTGDSVPTALHQGLARIHRLLVTPAAVVLFAAGIYLAVKAELFDRTWVSLPMLITIVLLGLVGAYFIPREKRLAAMAGEKNADYERLSHQVATVAAIAALVTLIAVFLMVVKP